MNHRTRPRQDPPATTNPGPQERRRRHARAPHSRRTRAALAPRAFRMHRGCHSLARRRHNAFRRTVRRWQTDVGATAAYRQSDGGMPAKRPPHARAPDAEALRSAGTPHATCVPAAGTPPANPSSRPTSGPTSGSLFQQRPVLRQPRPVVVSGRRPGRLPDVGAVAETLHLQPARTFDCLAVFQRRMLVPAPGALQPRLDPHQRPWRIDRFLLFTRRVHVVRQALDYLVALPGRFHEPRFYCTPLLLGLIPQHPSALPRFSLRSSSSTRRVVAGLPLYRDRLQAEAPCPLWWLPRCFGPAPVRRPRAVRPPWRPCCIRAPARLRSSAGPRRDRSTPSSSRRKPSLVSHWPPPRPRTQGLETEPRVQHATAV